MSRRPASGAAVQSGSAVEPRAGCCVGNELAPRPACRSSSAFRGEARRLMRAHPTAGRRYPLLLTVMIGAVPCSGLQGPASLPSIDARVHELTAETDKLETARTPFERSSLSAVLAVAARDGATRSPFAPHGGPNTRSPRRAEHGERRVTAGRAGFRGPARRSPAVRAGRSRELQSDWSLARRRSRRWASTRRSISRWRRST